MNAKYHSGPFGERTYWWTSFFMILNITKVIEEDKYFFYVLDYFLL